MARQLQTTHPLSSVSPITVAAASLLLCAFALLMCASHARKWRRRWNACLDYGYEYDEPVIELNVEATIVTTEGANAVEVENNNDDMFFSREQRAAVWQKNILMGGKCELPDFSGVIIYDTDGNVATPAKTPRHLLAWK